MKTFFKTYFVVFIAMIATFSSLLGAKPAPPAASSEEPKFYLSGSFIYWKPNQDCMSLGARFPYTVVNSENTPPNPSIFSSTGVRIPKPHPHYSPGFKVSAGYVLPHDHWSLLGDFTHFDSQTKKTVRQPPGSPNYPMGSLFIGFIDNYWIADAFPTSVSSSIKAEWNLHFNDVNVGIERSCDVSCHFVLRPFIGLAGAWIDQALKETLSLYTPGGGPMLSANLAVKSRVWAVGPRFGLGADWKIVSRLSLIGYAGLDLLYNDYHLQNNQYAPQDSTVYFKAKDHISAFRVESDLYLALNWNNKLSQNTQLDIAVGYEIQAWWNQNMIRSYIEATDQIDSDQGNLYLQGLTVTAKVRF